MRLQEAISASSEALDGWWLLKAMSGLWNWGYGTE